MRKGNLLLFALLLPNLSWGDAAFPVENNLGIFGESDFKLYDLNRDACAEVAAYYLLAALRPDRKILYDDVLKKFSDKFGTRPYSFLAIEHYLFEEGIRSKILKLECRDDIFEMDARHLILYFPPLKEGFLGHFSYARRNSKDVWEIFDPEISEFAAVPFASESRLFKRWEGIFLLPQSK